jgi:hypothetical protein
MRAPANSVVCALCQSLQAVVTLTRKGGTTTFSVQDVNSLTMVSASLEETFLRQDTNATNVVNVMSGASNLVILDRVNTRPQWNGTILNQRLTLAKQ